MKRTLLTLAIAIFSADPAPAQAPAPSGTVITIDDKGIDVATGDGSVRFAKLAIGGPKVAAA